MQQGRELERAAVRRAASRTPCNPRDLRFESGSESGARRLARRSSWLSPFPRPAPPMHQRHRCSPASQVLRTHLTSYWRSYQHYRRKRSLTVPSRGRKPIGSPGSRVWSFHACTGSLTPPRRTTTRLVNAIVHVAFPLSSQGRHAKRVMSELLYLACVYPFPMLHPRRCRRRRMGQGRDGWLSLSSYDSFIRNSKPVYPGAFNEHLCRQRSGLAAEITGSSSRKPTAGHQASPWKRGRSPAIRGRVNRGRRLPLFLCG